MQTLLQDLRYSARMLTKKRGITVVAVITLGLGIGANTTMFSVINGLLLLPMPFKDPGRLVHLAETAPKVGFEKKGLSFTDFADWRAGSRSAAMMALYEEDSVTLASGNATERAERVEGASVTASLFPLLGVEAIQGRRFLEEEDKPGAAPAAIIGYGLWRRRFGGDPGIIGHSVRIDGESVTVVGVMRAGFGVPGNAEILTPMAAAYDDENRGRRSSYGIGRLRLGVTIETARSEI